MEPLSSRPIAAQQQFTTRSEEETERLGEALGRVLEAGDFLGLIGELGAGKTRFVRGLSRGAAVAASEVASPTFAIVHPYRGRILIHHADLYRLADPDELYATGYFELLGGEGAVVVEWVDRVPVAAPADALLLTLSAPSVDEDTLRDVRAVATGERSAQLLARWSAAL